jgi:hypothetical protein
MTIGEIKKEALKLMFTNQDNEIDSNYITVLLEDDNYGDYLVNMNGSINRAIVRLKSKGVEYTGDRLKSDASEDFELDLDEELCMMIPYFIKGELYEEDNAQQAAIARNLFEDMVDDYLATKEHTTVDVVFEMDV